MCFGWITHFKNMTWRMLFSIFWHFIKDFWLLRTPVPQPEMWRQSLCWTVSDDFFLCVFQFEGLPTYPDVSRMWEIVDKYHVTKFYTAPTAIRLLMKYGSEPVQKWVVSEHHKMASSDLVYSTTQPCIFIKSRFHCNRKVMFSILSSLQV